MKLLLISLCIFSSFAMSSKRNIERSFTPDKFQEIDWTTERSLATYQKVLGKSDLTKDGKYYYEVSGIKYPISLHTKKEKIEKVYFRVLGDKPNFKQLSPYLKDNNFKVSKVREKDYKVYISQKKKIMLRFKEATQKLYSVEKWF